MSLSLTPPRFSFSFSGTLPFPHPRFTPKITLHPKYSKTNTILDDGMKVQLKFLPRAVAHHNPSAVDCPSSFPKDARPSIVSFTPCVWGDIFSSFSLDEQLQEKYAKEIDELKEEARTLLIGEESTKAEKLVLIDTLERLGVAYHFEVQIEKQLEEVFNFHLNSEDDDLLTTALQFRLLRQHRYHAPCGVFDKFKDKNNEFDAKLNMDVVALLSLYQAAHLRIHGEEILEQALVFTTYHLNRLLPELESPLQDEVRQALQQPLHRGVARVETRNYISIYEKYEAKNAKLLKLAKLDFNYLQNLYRKELCELTRWWNNFDLKSKLPYMRDRLANCYLWGQWLHFEPQYSYVRIVTAKCIQMMTVMNDMYDNYATLDEAHLFTEAIEKWDISEVDRLPESMQIVYKYILSVYDDNERDAAEQGKLYAADLAKDTAKEVAQAYNRQLKWFMGRQMPTFEEYYANTLLTSIIHVVIAMVIPGMPSANSAEIRNWFQSEPKIIKATNKIGRYLDDVASHERESRGGETLTAVDCYMKQHGISKEETMNKFLELSDEGWKDLNTAWLEKTTMPKDMIEMVLNYGRAGEVTYKDYIDRHTYPEEPLAAAQFVNPIIM